MFYFVKKQNQEKIKNRAGLPCLLRLFELVASFFLCCPILTQGVYNHFYQAGDGH